MRLCAIEEPRSDVTELKCIHENPLSVHKWACRTVQLPTEVVLALAAQPLPQYGCVLDPSTNFGLRWHT